MRNRPSSSKISALVLCLICSITTIYAQGRIKKGREDKPKLVVGMVIDQMRWDYLYRFKALYGNGGFNRLMREGFSCEQTLIAHLPTYTAVGHTSVYTGSVPAFHGIVGNYWHERSLGRSVYCSDDSTVSGVGSNTPAGKMSPANMITNTVGDELRLSNQFQSKVVGISLKDRGAIFPAGHSANAAYWYDENVGKWISSTYYMASLPAWVNAYNNRNRVEELMKQDWHTLLPLSAYTLSDEDAVAYESGIPGLGSTAFPHRLSQLGDKKYGAIRYTPHGNTFTLEFAKTAIQNESLGKGKCTDLLAVSLSSTDYTGHEFGPNSVEIQDMYLRLDKELASFFSFLDSAVGKGKYLFFLTADHGVAHVPGFLAKHKMKGGGISENMMAKEINDSIEARFGIKSAVAKFDNSQLYIQYHEIEKQGKDAEAVQKEIMRLLRAKPFVSEVYELNEIAESTLAEPVKTMVINGYYPKRSGDVQVLFKPGYFDRGDKGTSHAMWNPYDAHIPLVWMGWGIKAGKTHRLIHMADIAPTLSALLQIQMPNGSVGKVITEIIP